MNNHSLTKSISQCQENNLLNLIIIIYFNFYKLKAESKYSHLYKNLIIMSSNSFFYIVIL